MILLNMLCWGTNFQQASICKDISAEEVLEVFMKIWLQHYGRPVRLITDRGKEFYSDKLQQNIGGLGVGLHYIDAQSPWQNTRTEKAGGILKEEILATAQATAASLEELPLVIAETVACRNRYMDRYGFSPMQRVFGKNLRLPASLMSSDALNQELVDAAAPDPIHRAWQIREVASQEWLRRQDQGAVRRSIRAQSRTTDQVNIPIGSWAYVFRDSPSYKGWVGPGVTIAEDPSGKSTWISMRGRLWKASREQLRLATAEEELGAELIVEMSKEMLSKLHKPGHVVFQDVSAEGGPTDEYFDEVMRTLNIREDRPESQPRQRQSSTAESGETEEGSNSAVAPGSEQASRRASAVSEAADGAAPMQVIPEEAPMDETSDGTTPANAESMPSRSFGPSLTERMRRGPYTPPQILKSDDVLLGQPETPTMTRTSVTEPTPLFGNRSVTSPNPRTPYPFHAGTPFVPRPPGQSFFLEVIDFDNDSAEVAGQASMAFVLVLHGGLIEKCGEQRCSRTQMMVFHLRSQKLKRATVPEIDACMFPRPSLLLVRWKFSKLSEAEKVQFRASRKKELDSLVATGAVEILSVEDSLKFANETPEQIIDSKYVDCYKRIAVSKQKLEEHKAKALTQGHLQAIELES